MAFLLDNRLLLKQYYFPVFCAIALSIYSLQRFQIPVADWLDDYVNDLLCMPIVLFVCQYVIRNIKSNPRLKMDAGQIIILTFAYAIYFELFLPKFNLRYTADIIDVLLYTFGAIFFYMVENKTTG